MDDIDLAGLIADPGHEVPLASRTAVVRRVLPSGRLDLGVGTATLPGIAANPDIPWQGGDVVLVLKRGVTWFAAMRLPARR